MRVRPSTSRLKPLAALLAVTVTLGAPALASSPSSAAAGTSPPLHGYAFQPYRNAWALRIDRGARHVDVGTWTDELKSTPIHGRPGFTRIQTLKSRRNGATQTWVNVFDPRTLRSYSSALLDSDGGATLRSFGDRTVTITDATEVAGYPVVTRKLRADAYDFNGGMYGLLFLGLPLRPGLTGTLTTYGTADASIEHIRYRVRAREPMRGGARSFDTFVIEGWYLDAHRPEGDARMTFWLSTTPPYVIKLLYAVPSRKELWTYVMR